MFTKSPYPGLRPYTLEESYLFFGRDEMCDQLLDKLSGTRFLAVVGESGCGKSSLIRAGILPDLQLGFMPGAKSKWRIAQMKPGNRSFENLALALAKEEAFGPGIPGLTPDILRQGVVQFLSLMDSCKPEKNRPLLPDDTNLLILVDQFEEIFRYMESGLGNDAFSFISLMLDLAEQRSHNIYVVITMRTDFLGECASFQGLPEAINQGQFLVPRLSEFQLREAITEPARIFDCKVEEKLVSQIMEDAATNPDYLPLIQHALMRLYDAQKDKEKLLTLDQYNRLEGMEKILSNHADQAYNDLDAKQKCLAETLFRCLSAGEKDHRRDTRNPTEFYEILKVCSNDPGYEGTGDPNAQSRLVQDLKKVIDIFRDPAYNFLTPAKPLEIEMDTVIDISHESLIRQWVKLSGDPSGQGKEEIDREKKGWVKLEASKRKIYAILAEGAATWQTNGKQRDDLAKKSQIAMAQEWEKEERPTLDWAIQNDAALARKTDPGIKKAFEKHMASPRDKQLADQYRKKLEDWCKKRFDLTFEWREKSNRSAFRKQCLKTTGVVLLVTLLIAAVPTGLWFANYLNKEAIEDLNKAAGTADLKTASKLYEKAMDKGDHSLETMRNLVNVYMALLRRDDAVDLVEKYQNNTNHTRKKKLESELILANIHTEYGKADQPKACYHYKKANESYFELCHSQHLDWALKKQALEGKLELASRVLESCDPQFAIKILEGILKRADQMEQQQPDGYKEVFENTKTLAQTHLGLATAYYKQKNGKKAKKHYNEALKFKDLPGKYKNQIFTSAKLGLADICLNPQGSQGTECTPKFKEAITHYEKILNKIHCRNMNSPTPLPREHASFRLILQARLKLFSIYDLYPKDKNLPQQEYGNIMQFYIEQANLPEDIQKSLTSFFLRKKNVRLAMDIANQIQDRSCTPNLIENLLYLAQIFHREKYYDQAIEFYGKALAKQKGPSDIPLSLGAIYFTQRRYTEAEKHYDQFIRLNEKKGPRASQAPPGKSGQYSDINFSKTAYAWFGKACAQTFLKRFGDAESSFLTAKKMDPDRLAWEQFIEKNQIRIESNKLIHLEEGG